MLFKDKLNEKGSIINPEFERLFKLAVKNQKHPGDVLLWHINGHYSEDIQEGNKTNPKPISPYVIGMGKEGWAEHTHFDFIDSYRTQFIYGEPFSEYLKKHAYDPKRKAEIDKLVREESITIQLEMMVYLKVWEADMIIKKLYELVRILQGESYDWHFRVAASSRDTGATGTAQDIIRKHVRDKVQATSQPLFDAIKLAYKTQLRNSIAHSNYSFLGRHIHPNNYVASDPASQLKAVSFDEWIDIFHTTLMLQNGLMGFGNMAHKHYSEIALKNKNLNEILVTKADGTTESRNTYYRAEYKEWTWETSIAK